MAKRYGVYGLGTARRVRRKVIPLSAARKASRRLRAVRRTRLVRRAAKWGLKGLAVGLAAKYVIGKARRRRTARKTEVFKTAGQNDTRTLYSASLTDIARGTDIDKRNEDDIQIAGYRIKGEIGNINAGALYVNVALVSHRDSGNTLTHEFFRHDGTVRSVDFGTALSAIEIAGNPLNTDKFAVLKHRRYRLNGNPVTAGYSEGSGKSYMDIDWYQPINRNIQYDTSASTNVDASSNIYLLYWMDLWGATAGASIEPTVAMVNWKVVAYHHDT